mmetsp:Transcript_26196/g.78912  ORF Transcript_26196/g.78912 Transcript_26196/m.78912 type:complete len:129 (-) Transcript_26196:31-417(-)
MLSIVRILPSSALMPDYATVTRVSANVSTGTLDSPVSDVWPVSKQDLLTMAQLCFSIAACPNDCNANGMCLTLARLGQLYGIDYYHPGTGGDGVGPVYENWDKDSVTSCFCDAGFSGPDCSRREFRVI